MNLGMTKLSLQELHQILLAEMIEIDSFCRNNGIHYYFLGGSALGAVRHKGFIPWDDDIDIGMLRKDYQKFISLGKNIGKGYFLQNYHTEKNVEHCLTRVCIENTFHDEEATRKLKKAHNIYIDVFPLDNVPESVLLRKKQKNKIHRLRKLLFFKLGYSQADANIIKKTAKKIIGFILRLVSFRNLICSIDKTMRLYENETTTCVCSMASQYSYEKQTMNIKIYGKPTLAKFETHDFYIPENWDAYLTQLFGDYMTPPSKKQMRVIAEAYIIKE